jgi:hypothetical protein
MPKIKSHKTVEQIAKKHRMDVSDIQKQLDMGEPIEHEHTRDHELAMDIALQHLDEIPDYYTRLKKMESDAKKHHKKFKDVKEDYDSDNDDMDSSMMKHSVHSVHVEYDKRYCPKCKKVQLRSECKYGSKYWDIFSSPAKLKEEIMQKEQRYCPLCDKRETRSECSYGGKAWDKVSVKDHEYSMARSELDTLVKAAERIKKKVGKGEGSLEAWVQSKITKAADYIDTAADYLGSDEKIDEGSQISFNVDPQKLKADKKASKIRTLAQQGATEGEREAAKNKTTGPSLAKGSLSTGVINAEYEPSLVEKILKELEEEKNPGLWTAIRNRRDKGLPRKKPGQKGYPKTLDIDEDLAQARKNVGASKCWKNKKIGNPPTKIKGGKEVPNCVPSKGVSKAKGYKKESVTIEDANGNPYIEFIDLIKPDPMLSPKSTFMANNSIDEVLVYGKVKKEPEDKRMTVTTADKKGNTPAYQNYKAGDKRYKAAAGHGIDEATRLQSQTGNIIAVTILWRGKYYAMRMFFPQVKLPSRQEVTTEIQKVYPGARVVHHSVSEFIPGQPLIQAGFQGGSAAKLGPNKNYVKPMGEEVEIEESKKSEMPCNKPKAEAHGSGETGKSHAVKACKDGKEKLIRFGQLGVKGSPKKEGESKEYASRRHRFQTRHAKNIAKGNMSAAYWANKVKW